MTKTFKKTALAMAVAAASAAVVPVTNAVNLAENGLGEYAIVPYYTVRDGVDTYISVTNTSDRTAVFKIRWREALNSREVLDFNVVLSPKDVWTSAVTVNEAGDGGRVVTSDRSCTGPIAIRDSGTVDFVSWEFDGTTAPEDGGPTDLDRTKEGYFEVINMGTTIDEVVTIASKGVHVNGEPVDCNAVEDVLFDTAAANAQLGEPMNVLKVNVAYIKVASGTGFSGDAVTLANFYNPGVTATDGEVSSVPGTNVYFDTGDDRPLESNANPATSDIHTDTVGMSLTSNWVSAEDAVSAVIMRTSAINQYRVEDGAADTDWVVTFPTKKHYVDNLDLLEPNPPRDPFPNARDETTGLACITAYYGFYNREEGSDTPDVIRPPSPRPPEARPDEICHEANVIAMGSGVLKSANAYNVEPPFTAGWMNLGIDQNLDLVSSEGHAYSGLPVVGYAVTELDNLNSDKPDVQYGFLWDHSYNRMVSGY